MKTVFFMILLLLTAIFMIGLVLIQRGKGGGLSGAFGGLGGQSAFGTKAGDTFTKITIGVAVFWIVLCLASVRMLATPEQDPLGGGGNVEQKADETSPGSEGSAARDLPGGASAPLPPTEPASGGATE
jgi:preprotein translocase subunit SecG